MKFAISDTLGFIAALIVAACVTACLTACGGSGESAASPNAKTAPSPFDTTAFQNLAKDTSCAELENRLFVIDQQYVLSEKIGNCADARYRQTLYGKSPDNILCTNVDSIAGPRYSCNDTSLSPLFRQIINNLDIANLGLDNTHQVQQISVTSGKETSLSAASLAPRLFYGQAPINAVIKDGKLWQQFTSYGGFSDTVLPTLDFTQQMLMGVFAKSANNCNDVGIHKVTSNGQRVLVQYSERSIVPIASCDPNSSARATPMNLVVGQRLYLPVDFMDVSGAIVAQQLVTQSNISGVQSSRYVVIHDQSSWEKLWAEHDQGKQAIPAIDFSQKMVIAVFSGLKPNGCYGIADVQIWRYNGSINVSVRESSPSPVALCALYLPSPAYLVAIDKTSEPVEFTTILSRN
ncbi:hypothetical protein RF679_04890 [Undibacterium cyanobacteriorum]|uniref:PrcB C-terminal domain-containing protein n=1 Tax=Undibacterium cyanobacteriorum TaxID=3073561 RepID=A0ABY9RK64_9BURK|nr:hypothetical protein [Undibacterium sp. 20NA77.5]WMW81620.1 hypothetical protein RF679_04890 [Undibacterium sp. 20NA77.5]